MAKKKATSEALRGFLAATRDLGEASILLDRKTCHELVAEAERHQQEKASFAQSRIEIGKALGFTLQQDFGLPAVMEAIHVLQRDAHAAGVTPQAYMLKVQETLDLRAEVQRLHTLEQLRNNPMSTAWRGLGGKSDFEYLDQVATALGLLPNGSALDGIKVVLAEIERLQKDYRTVIVQSNRQLGKSQCLRNLVQRHAPHGHDCKPVPGTTSCTCWKREYLNAE